jgi:hypothetical protein
MVDILLIPGRDPIQRRGEEEWFYVVAEDALN